MPNVVENFKKRVVEGKYTVFVSSMVVLAMRFSLFYVHGPPQIPVSDTGFLWQYIAHFFTDPLISFGVSTLFVFLIAFLLSGLNNRFSLIRTRTNLPFLVPLVLFSLHPVFLTVSPCFFSLTLVLTALFPLLSAYQQTDSRLFSFRSAILIGLAGLFQIYALLLLPLWWRGEMTMRGSQPKSFFTFLFGVFLVYISVFSFYFLIDNVVGFVMPFHYFTQFSTLQAFRFSVVEWIGIILLFGFLLMYVLLSMNLSARAKKLALSSTNFMVFIIFFSIIFQAVYWHETKFFFWLNIALISYLIAYYHSRSTLPVHVFIAIGMTILLAAFYLLNLLF